MVRDMDLSILHSQIKDNLQYGIIEFLRAYRLTDIMFIRGSPSEFYTIHRIAGDRRTFQEVVVSASLLNLLQLATLGGQYELVKYLLLEHKILSNTK